MALENPKLPGTRKVGKPLEYETPQELEEWIDMYFDECKQNRNIQRKLMPSNQSQENPVDYDALVLEKEHDFTEDIHPTVTGLALYLGMSRLSLINYEGREEYVNIVKMGKARVETYLDQKTYSPNNNGVQFNLKNNFNWKDKQEIDHGGGLTVNIGNKDAGNL